MAVVIRLRRTGRKNLPCYRITVTDKRFPRDGRTLETLGQYDPLRRDPAQQVKLDQERIGHWLQHGATVSEVVQSIFKRMGIFPPKPHVKRSRPGRKKPTATRAGRVKIKLDRQAAKKTRFDARRATKRAAAKAAATAKA